MKSSLWVPSKPYLCRLWPVFVVLWLGWASLLVEEVVFRWFGRGHSRQAGFIGSLSFRFLCTLEMVSSGLESSYLV
ncbi:hypothetical protein Bca4012_058693 [Brassica carinata]